MALKFSEKGGEIKDIDTKTGTVKGYFAHFGSIDSDSETFVKGAFYKTNIERGPNSLQPRIKHLFNHWETIGVLKELKEDSYGLFYVSKMGTHAKGLDVLKMYESGIITEHSVGFETIKYQQEKDTRLLTEVKLWEGSALDKWGANQNTPVIKSLTDYTEAQSKYDIILKMLHNGTLTDEAFIDLEYQLMQLKQAFINLSLEVGKPRESLVNNQPNEDANKLLKAINELNNSLKL